MKKVEISIECLCEHLKNYRIAAKRRLNFPHPVPALHHFGIAWVVVTHYLGCNLIALHKAVLKPHRRCAFAYIPPPIVEVEPYHHLHSGTLGVAQTGINHIIARMVDAFDGSGVDGTSDSGSVGIGSAHQYHEVHSSLAHSGKFLLPPDIVPFVAKVRLQK